MRRLCLAAVSAALLLTACDGGDDTAPDVDALPGGEAGREVLEESGRLRDGVLSPGEVVPDDPAYHRAVCDYLFGSADEVAQVLGLEGDVALAGSSGEVSLGGNGWGYRCGYGSGDEAEAALMLWSQEIEFGEDSEAITVVNTEVADGWMGALIYHESVEVEPLDAGLAEQWLVEASGRTRALSQP